MQGVRVCDQQQAAALGLGVVDYGFQSAGGNRDAMRRL